MDRVATYEEAETPSKIVLAEFPGNGDKQQLFSFHIRVVSQNEERGSKIP